MDTQTRIVRLPELIAAEMDGDLVMMSIERGAYYGIGGIGPRVWELLEQPACIADLVSVIEAEFEVDTAVCERDLLAFASGLLDRGIVKIC